MKLFHVQDTDRPMYVLAPNWGEAVKIWQDSVTDENEAGCCGEPDQPSGVNLVCEEADLLLPAERRPSKYNIDLINKGYIQCDCCLCGTKYFIKPVEGVKYGCPNATCANGRHDRHAAHFESFRSGLAKLRHDWDFDSDAVKAALDGVEKLVEESFKAPVGSEANDPPKAELPIHAELLIHADWPALQAGAVNVGNPIKAKVRAIESTLICDPPHDGIPATFRRTQRDVELVCTELPGAPSIILTLLA